MVCENFIFLGASQTFIGVLLTIFLLCIFHENSNNFIEKMLQAIKNNICSKIESLKNQNSLHEIKDIPEYKQLTTFLQSTPLDDKQKKLHEEGSKISTFYLTEKSKLLTKYAPLQVEFNNLNQIIDNAKEQVWAPLFCFLYCVLLFVFDEFLRYTSTWFVNYLISVIVVFTLYSFIFWLIVWGHFYLKNIYKMKISMRDSPSHRKSVSRSFLSYSLNILLFYAIVIFIFSEVLPPLNSFSFIIVLGLAPFLYFTINKYKSTMDNCTELFVFGHFGVLFFLSISFCAILFFYDTYIGKIEFYPYNDALSKFAIFAFALINGLIFPFLMPFLAYKAIENKIRKDIVKASLIAEQAKNEIMDQLRSFVKQIE